MNLKSKKKGPMGTTPEPQTRMVPMMRNPMMPMAVMGRSPKSQAEAMERMEGMTERHQRMMEAKEEMEAKYLAKRIKFPKIKR